MESIRTAVSRLLDEPAFAEAARALGAEIVNERGAVAAVDQIEALARVQTAP